MFDFDKFTIPEILKNSFSKYSNQIALAGVGSEKITYTELNEKIEAVKQFLKNEGIVKGDRVAIISENMPNWGIAFFAITTMGAIAVPIMTEYHRADIHHVLRHSGAKAVFVSNKQFEKISECEVDEIHTAILIDDFSIIPCDADKDLLARKVKEGKKEFAKIKMAALQFAGLTTAEVEEDDLASIVYTSGTTGHSKGVMLTHKNIAFDAAISNDLAGVTSGDRHLSILPLAHTMESTLGLVLMIMAGATVNYLMKPPTASNLMPALAKVKPTVIISVPLVIEKIFKLRILPEINKKAMVRTLYKVPTLRKKLHKVAGKKLLKTFGGELKMIALGGAKLAFDVERFLNESRFPYAVGYGLTETSPLVVGGNNLTTRFRATGKPLKGVEIKLENPDPETGEGEILIKGDMVMKGYYKDDEKTKEVLTDDGWFKSGDLGIIDKDGFLFIKGRSKNVIIGSNGKNIYPEEIESHILEMPYVLEALVYESENKIIARVFLNYDEIDKDQELYKLTESEAEKKINDILKSIHTAVNQRVSTFSKIHKIIEQPEEFDKTPTKKIKRYIYG